MPSHEMTACQQKAFDGAIHDRMHLISGPAGTGKTTVLNDLVRHFSSRQMRVVMAAPTGKAAKRLEQVTGRRAQTIHRLLGYNGEVWQHNSENPVDADVVIVDECFDYKQPILTERGWMYIGAVVNNERAVRVWSLNPDSGRLELKPILRWLKRDAPNRRPPFYPGDKVMQIKNDYGIDVMNGHIGYVVEAEPRQKRWVVDFEDRGEVELDDKKIGNVVLAYACTIHKFQGSEIPCAVCILHSSHSFMLHRNLAYTAVTRARDRAVIIGDVKGIQRAVRIQRVDDRRTILAATGGVVQ